MRSIANSSSLDRAAGVGPWTRPLAGRGPLRGGEAVEASERPAGRPCCCCWRAAYCRCCSSYCCREIWPDWRPVEEAAAPTFCETAPPWMESLEVVRAILSSTALPLVLSLSLSLPKPKKERLLEVLMVSEGWGGVWAGGEKAERCVGVMRTDGWTSKRAGRTRAGLAGLGFVGRTGVEGRFDDDDGDEVLERKKPGEAADGVRIARGEETKEGARFRSAGGRCPWTHTHPRTNPPRASFRSGESPCHRWRSDCVLRCSRIRKRRDTQHMQIQIIDTTRQSGGVEVGTDELDGWPDLCARRYKSNSSKEKVNEPDRESTSKSDEE